MPSRQNLNLYHISHIVFGCIVLAILSSCASSIKYYEPPPDSAESALLVFEFNRHEAWYKAWHRIELELVNGLEISNVGFEIEDWQKANLPAVLDGEKFTGVALAPGHNDLWLKSCRFNGVPFCSQKCALSQLRIDAVAGEIYQVTVLIGDETSEFSILDYKSGEAVVGPVEEESYCQSGTAIYVPF